MHSKLLVVVFIFDFLTWHSSALPCDGSSGGATYDVGYITCPEEVILVQVSEGGDDDEAFENPGEPYRIPTDGEQADHGLGGEVVESAANESVPQVANFKYDPLSSLQNGNQEVSKQTTGNEDATRGVGVSTESVNVKQ